MAKDYSNIKMVINMKVNLKMELQMVSVNTIITMVMFMKDNFIKIKNMEQGLKNIKMEKFMKVILPMIKKLMVNIFL